MQGIALLRRCLQLVEQGDLAAALEMFNSKALPELLLATPTAKDGSLSSCATVNWSAAELAESARLVQQLLQSTKLQQHSVQAQLRSQRHRTMGRNAYAGSA